MTITVAGQPVANLFAAGNSGLQTKFTIGGTDLGAMFAAYSSGAHAPATSLTHGGVDLSTLFQKAGAAPSLIVGLTPDSIVASGPSGTVVSGPATATPTGGTPGYSYLWAVVSGSGVTITSPTSPTTTFSATATTSASVHCTVTDSLGVVASSAVLPVSFTVSLLTAVLSPSDGYAEHVRTGSGSQSVSLNVTCATMNAAGPLTYAWSLTSNPGGATLLNATLATCTLAKSSTGILEITGSLQCIVSDGVTTLTPTGTFELVISTGG